MGTFDIYTRSFWDGNYELVKSGEVPASGSINCFHFLTPYLEGTNELESRERHIHEEFALARYSRDSVSDGWELSACDSLEDAQA